ncbi:hypothetical protein LEN26_000726 [Aphanomyces euteiches]|nr:hypothetical protein LEN26_000726 [Aphanomyces euteiches]
MEQISECDWLYVGCQIGQICSEPKRQYEEAGHERGRIRLTMEVKSGMLFKRGEGGLFKRKNWKRRYFKLTPTEFTYYCPNTGVVKGTVDLSECTVGALEIMPEDCPKTGKSASTEWRVAINTPTRRFFISAPTEFEMQEWVDALMIVLQAFEKTRGSLCDLSP